MSRFSLFVLLLPFASLAFSADGPPEPTAKPLLRAVDLKCGEAAEVELCNGAKVRVKLLELKETTDSLRQAVREARVQVEVDGQTAWLTSANYQLAASPWPACRSTARSPRGRWPTASSERVGPGERRPAAAVARRLAAGAAGHVRLSGQAAVVRQFHADGQRAVLRRRRRATRRSQQIYYHYGLDFGGCGGHDRGRGRDRRAGRLGRQRDVCPATRTRPSRRATTWSTCSTPGAGTTATATSQSIDRAIRPGVTVQAGAAARACWARKGGSGGWTHLHFDIYCRQPSGKWGCQEAYAFAWEAYQQQYEPKLSPSPGRTTWRARRKGDARRQPSWSADGRIAAYQWTFTDGTTADGPRVERAYHDGPATTARC